MRKTFVILVAAVIGMAGIAIAGDADPYVIAESRVAPEYPPAANAAGFNGSVAVAAVIHPDGSVGDVEVLESNRPKLGFEEAAVDAIKQWRFQPAMQEGEPVESLYAYVFNFYPTRNRDQFAGAVTGEFLATAPLAGVGAKPGDGASMFSGAGFGAMQRRVQDYFTKPKLPPMCNGCMYDRTKLLPPRIREINFPKHIGPN